MELNHTNSEPIRVLLVDDEDLVRYGLRMICQAHKTIDVVGEACNGQDAIAQAQALRPDVVLMDISMPLLDGVSATRQIRTLLPQTKVLILTAHEKDNHLIEAVQNGASGYFLKNTPPEDVVPIICATHKGYLQIGPTLAQKLCQQLQSSLCPKPPGNNRVRGQLGITPRESEVLSLIAEGASNREIAQILHITEKTVKNHVSSLLHRVGLRDRTQLALWQTQVSA
ncbi:MAG: response regulator transcription factor [Leptolyngbya sp. SIO3F4]|nr:response regulator transcription factor [Leptolyngbya sp. SIO3F4]